MSWKYDAAISSGEYFDLARMRHRRQPARLPPRFQHVFSNETYHFCVDLHHVDMLLDRSNWSPRLIEENRRPRVFIDGYFNQSGNLEIRCLGGQHGILFEEDFTRDYFRLATHGHIAGNRSAGEIMWIDGFDSLAQRVESARCPVAKALLFGFKARLSELLLTISSETQFLGAMDLDLTYVGKNVASMSLKPTISRSELQALQRQVRERREPSRP